MLSPSDAVQAFVFNSESQQACWVAEQIAGNLENDELDTGDVLVIFANPLSVQKDAGVLIAELRSRGIDSHIAGVTRSADEFFLPDSVVISGIYRAKGNEAPMVYVLGAEYCHEGVGLIRRRNILFTAITRSRAWVRVCGVGSEMEKLCMEWRAVQENHFRLSFNVPTADELQRIRRIHRDRTEDEIQRIESSRKSLDDILDMLEREEITLDDLAPSTRQRLLQLLNGSSRGNRL
jgi:superfamily I DNA and RNA helicase